MDRLARPDARLAATDGRAIRALFLHDRRQFVSA